MQISTCEIKNVKGRNAAISLAAVSVIIADNYAGKTTVPTAIRLALSKQLPPPLGKRPESIYKLAGNHEEPGSMGVRLTFDDGRKIGLKLEKDAKGKVSMDSNLSPSFTLPEFLLEPKLFWSKTGAERVKAIFDACDISKSGFGADAIRQQLSKVDAMPAATCQVTLDEIEKVIKAVFVPEVSPQRATETLLTWVKERQKTAKQDAERAAGAFQAFRTKTQGIRPTDVTAELTEARAKLHRATEAPAVDTSYQEGRLRHVIDVISGILADYTTDGQPARAALQERIDSLAKSINETAKPLPFVESKLVAAKVEADNLTATLLNLDKDIAATAGQLAVVEKFDLCKECQEKIISPTKKALKALEKKRAKAAQEEAKAKSAVLTLQNEQAAANQAAAAYAKALAEWNQALTDAKADLSQLDSLTREKAELQTALEAADKPDPAKLAQADAIRAEVTALEAKDAAWQQYRRDLGRRDELEAELLTAQCQVEVYKQVAKMVTEESAKIAETAFNEVLATARHFTDGLLNSPLEMVDGDLGRRISARDHEMGNTAPIGSWVSHETFSGFEQATAHMAFAVALCAKAPFKLVLVDDVIIDGQHKVDIVKRFAELTAKGIIDQAILVDCDGDHYRQFEDCQGVKLITL